ncbi:MAG: hypothetical protein MMC33_005812 [Icmadophila ericetorum]|nr:hypothetical protein [Icmadophila ericetorum]
MGTLDLPQVRSRHQASSKRPATDDTSDDDDEKVKTLDPKDLASRHISILDIFRVLAGLFLLSSTLSYFVTNDSILWGYRPAFTKPARRGPVLLTDSELSLYNGTSPHLPIYLALNGTIYDVSASPHTYGPGGSYHFFAGRDATRAFITGCFQEDLTWDLRGVEEIYVPLDLDMEPQDKEGRKGWKMLREREFRRGRETVRGVVRGWEETFSGRKNGGKYYKVGRVVGRDIEALEPKRELCEQARKARPKSGKGEED